MKNLLRWMLIFVPVALAVRLGNGSPFMVFILAGLGIIPLAGFIGASTEALAHYTGPRLGGLLNATLGNAAELIITVFAIREGLLDLVRASITGSILGNLLLVLGLSIFAGGWKNGIQRFDRRQASINATLVILSVVALMIPSLFHNAFEPSRSAYVFAELSFSESVAVVMIALYGFSLLYALRAHGAPVDTVESDGRSGWSLRYALGVLAVSTIGTVIMSEVLVGAVEAVTSSIGLSELFLGIIIIPIIGNAAEHLVAVEMALKDKMELSLSVSLGSSLQVALFVAPVLVFISLLFQQRLLLVFTTFELISLSAAALIAAFIAQDGESNWLEGVMLLAVYLIIGLAFFFVPTA
jgi:Ca2+:H+ antiporter